MADNYEMPYMDTNKPRENIQKNTGLPGYVSYSMVLLMFVLMLLAAVVLAVGTGLLVYFVAGSDKECKVVFPENCVPNTGEQKRTDTTTDSATNGDTTTTNGDTYTETPEETSIASLQNSITKILAQLDHPSNGATYTRWGRTKCPGNSTTIYAGYAVGSSYSHSGGMVNTLCLHTEPQWGNIYSSQQPSYIYGAEYNAASAQYTSIFGKSLLNQDVPCVVCQASGRSSLLMVPARTECMDGWFREYEGYLMTSHISHSKSDVKCVDNDPEVVVGESADSDGTLFYFVEPNGQIANPPYIRGRELTCVVCTQ